MVRNGRLVVDISEALGIRASLSHKWKSRSNLAASPSSNGIPSRPETVTFKYHEKLKAKVKQLEQERDILKKALSIFSRED